MIHIIGKGNGEAVVFEEESPPKPKYQSAEPNPGMDIADRVDAMVSDDDLRPAGSNAAPPLG